MKTLLRWLLKTILGLLAVLALCIAVLVAANWRDDLLMPEAAHLLAPPAPPASDAPNAYDVLMGMDAPDDEDALTAGRQRQNDIDRQFRENPARTDYAKPPQSKTICSTDGNAQCNWQELRCPLAGTDCIDFYLDEKDRIRQFAARQTVLRQRYREFSRISVFDEPPLRSAHMTFPPYQLLTQAAELRLMDAVMALNEGDLTAGAQTLMEEISVHRRFLANSSLLISKLIAVAMLRRDYAVLGDAIEHWPLLAQQTTLAPAWLALQGREYDLRKTMEFETIFGANAGYYWFFRSPKDVHIRPPEFAWSESLDWLFTRFILPNATTNLYAALMAELAQSMQGDATTADVRRQAYAAKLAQKRDHLFSWTSWRSLRNPVGKFLTLSPPSYYDYAERIYDLDGYIRLIALQAALRRDGVPLANVASYAQRAAPDLRNPYDGQPMHWDAASATLSFEGRQSNIFNPEDAPKTFSVRLQSEPAPTRQEKTP